MCTDIVGLGETIRWAVCGIGVWCTIFGGATGQPFIYLFIYCCISPDFVFGFATLLMALGRVCPTIYGLVYKRRSTLLVTVMMVLCVLCVARRNTLSGAMFITSIIVPIVSTPTHVGMI